MAYLRFLSIFLVITLLAAVSVGCRHDDGDGLLFDVPQDVYLPATIPFPALPDHEIESVVVSDAKVFFSAINYSVDASISVGRLFSMNIDGSDLTELTDYNVSVPSLRISGGNVQLGTLHIDSDGFLWLVESGLFFSFEFIENEDGTQEGIPNYIRSNILRKLDDTGTELFSLDITDITEKDFHAPVTLCTDANGNIYVGIMGTINVLDPAGSPQFTLDIWGGDNTQIIRLPCGTAAGFGWQDLMPVLRKIDVVNRTWGETIELPPMNIQKVFPGNDEFTVIFNDGVNLHGICSETGISLNILNWIDSGFNADVINDLVLLPDGRLLATTQMRRAGSHIMMTELVVLTKTPQSELPEITLLTLATFGLTGDVRDAVLHFNRNSTTHRIQVLDYSIFNTHDDHHAGLTRLHTEIIAGRAPDLLDMTNLPFDIYVARGLLEDLNPFLDTDPELKRSDLMDGVLRAAEIDGALYRMFPTFEINTIIGNPAVVGSGQGWTIHGFKAALEANPQADMPMGTEISGLSFLQTVLWHNIEQFVDWESGTANFDNSYFIEILELTKTFPAEQDTYVPTFGERVMNTASGRQIMVSGNFRSFGIIQEHRTTLGGEIVFKGFPTENRDGNKFSITSSVAITIACHDKQGAWGFVRTLVTDDFQREFGLNRLFSVNKIIFEEAKAHAMDPDNRLLSIWEQDHSVYIDSDELSQEEANMIMALIDSITGILEHDENIWNIISEDASDYFRGRGTAQDAARVIQSRVAIYLSELG